GSDWIRSIATPLLEPGLSRLFIHPSASNRGSGRRDRAELSLLQPASESDCELILAGAKEVTKLLRPVIDMPAGTVQIVFSDALLFELCKCHASTSSADLRSLTRVVNRSRWGKRNGTPSEFAAT